MFNYKKNVFRSFSILAILLFLTVAIIFIIDPLQHYRKASLYKAYAFDSRYMVWGLLKNYEYDSVFIGSSMTENFKKDYIDEDLKINILRVPFPGASAYEENLIIKKAVKNKNLKTILYGLDMFSFEGKQDRLGHGEGSIPFYMYDDNAFNDFKYLLNIDILFESNVKIILSNYFSFKKNMIDINTFWNWDHKDRFDKKIWVKNFQNRLHNSTEKVYKIYELKKSFDYNILSNINNNKSIKFQIFFPPYSILSWKYWEYKKELKSILEFKKYILMSTKELENVEIYDFQIAKSITHNLDNYMDMNHYSPKINRWMIEQIKNNNYLVKKENIYENLENLEKQIKNYDLNKNL